MAGEVVHVGRLDLSYIEGEDTCTRRSNKDGNGETFLLVEET